MYSQIITQDPLDALLTLDEAKKQCRVTHTFDDDLITAFIPVAAELAQAYTNRILSPATVVSVVEQYYPEVQLPFGDVTTINTVEIDGVVTTDFEFEPVTQKVTVNASYGKLKVNYDCGFVTLPKAVKQAMLLTISTLYNNRENFVTGVTIAKLPQTSEMLLNTVKYYGI